MGWNLEIVDSRTEERRVVFEFGTIAAPENSDQVGLNPQVGQDVLQSLQMWMVGQQEEAIKCKARTLRHRQPHLRLKDYRSRKFHTLFGTASLRVPRLVSASSSVVPPDLLPKSEGAISNYDRLRAKLGAWMSFRAAEGFLLEMFPHASSAGRTTLQRKVLACAQSGPLHDTVKDTLSGHGEVEIGIDTTFIRNADKSGPRSLEVLVGTGRNSLGKSMQIAGVSMQPTVPLNPFG